MNKIFKVIWNHATQSWVAVSEFTKAHGKTKSVKLSAVATAIAAATTVGTAHAAVADSQIQVDAATNSVFMTVGKNQSPTVVNQFSDQHPGLPTVYGRTDGNNAIGRDGIRIGTAMTTRDGQILIGNNLQNVGYAGDVVVGNRARLGGGGNDSFSTLVGYGTVGAGPSVSIGVGAQADMASIRGSLNGNVASIAVGAYSYTGGNIDGSTAVGAEAFAQRNASTAIGQQAGMMHNRQNPYRSEQESIAKSAATDASTVTVVETITFGEAANGGGVRGVSVGYQSSARSNDSVAIGSSALVGATLQASNSAAAVSVGNNTSALRNSTIAIGNNAIAGGYQEANVTPLQNRVTTAEAAVATAQKEYDEMTAAANANASHFNQYLQGRAKANLDTANLVLARAQEELKLAQDYKANSVAVNAIAIGNQAKAREVDSIAIGNATSVTGLNSIAIGNSSVVSGNTSIAIGHKNTVTGNNSGAFGDPNFVTSDQSFAFGNNNTVNSENTFVLGNSIGQGARNANLTGNTLANSVYLGTDSEAAAGQVADERTGSAGISQFTATRGGGNTQTAGTGTYKGTTLVTDFVNSALNDTGFDLATTETGFKYATTDGDPAGAQQAEYAGNRAVGVVTVGASGSGSAAGSERRIVNVAAGLVTSASTDAVNGSQLYAAMVQASRPISFTGNSNQDTGNDGTEQLLGSNLRIIGATTAAAGARDNSKETRDSYVAKNVATVVSNGEVQIQFADNPEFKSVDLEDDIVPDSSAMTSGTAPTDPNQLNKAVSLGDVLNTGWNVAVEGKAADFVRPYDTVNFIGEGVTITEEADSTNSRTNIKFKVDPIQTGTFAPAPTTAEGISDGGHLAAGDNPTAPATVQGVVDAVNGSFWKILSANGDAEAAPVGDSAVNPSNNVTFRGVGAIEVAEGAGTTDQDYNLNISVKTDGTTIRVNNQGQLEAITKAPETATVTNVQEGQDKAGSVTAPAPADEGKLVTAKTLADAINNSGFTLKTNAAEGGEEDAQSIEQDLIKAGETVEMLAGKNLKVKQEADGKVTYSTKENVEFTEIKVAAPKADGSTGDNPITIGNNAITGLNNTLAPLNTDPTKTAAPTFNDAKLGSAATLSDVLNAGWNLQNNGTAKDFVKAYDTVNFIDGVGTKAVVDVKADGTIADVKFDVDVTQLSAPIGNNEDGSLKDPKAVAEDALKAAQDEQAALPADASEEAKKAAADKVAAAQNAVNNAPTALATAQNVTDSVNNSFWNINTSQDGANEAKVGDGKVNPSNNVVFNGVGAVKVAAGTTDEGKYTVDFSVETAPLASTIVDNKNTGEVKSPVKAAEEALKAAQDEQAALPADASEEAKKAAADKVAAAQNAVNNAPNALATAQNVADAINNSGWNATSGTVGSGARSGADATVELINPSETVTFNAGDNLVIKQEENVFTYSLNKDININSANIGGVADNPDTADVNEAKAPITIGTVGTGPDAKNVISGLDSTLPKTVNKDDKQAPTTVQAAPTLTPADLTKAATIEDVLNAGWNLQNNGTAKDFVKPYDTVNFIDGVGTKAVVNVREDGAIADVKVDIDVTQLVAPVTNVVEGDKAGSVTGPVNNQALQDALKQAQDELAALPDTATEEEKKAAQDKVDAAQNAINNAPNALATAQNVADAINASGFTLKTGAQESGKNATPDASELINPSDTVTMIAGDNLVVAQEGGNVVYSLNPDININSAKIGGVPNPADAANPTKAPITIGTVDENGTPKNVIAGLDSTLPAFNTDPTQTAAPVLNETQLGSAATLNDVLNAGWNLQNNGTAKDFVKPYDTVNFVDGKGTKAVVDVKADGTIADVKFDVDVTQLSAPITNNEDGSVTGPANSTELADALTAAEEALAALPETATPEEKAAAEKAVQDAKDAITNAGNQLATAQNVADAINASGWNATSGKVGTGEVEGTTNELINPSETVTFQAGDNMMLKQEGNVFTYSVNPNPVFNNVTANQVTVGGTPATQDAPAKAPIVIGTNPEGVNEITGLDTTLPVPAAEQAKPADINESKAATLGDVLNAGWNLKNNGEARDVVTPYDTVDFVDGNGTKVSIDTVDGVSTVKVDVDWAQISSPVTNVVEGDEAGSVTGPTTAAEDALKAAQDELAALPADASEEAKQAAADKVAAAQNAVNNAGNQLATAQNVANAINNSGWKATSGTVGTGTRDGADATVELINPAETVTFNAGDNLVIEQAGNEFTYSLNKDIKVDSVTANQAFFGGSPETEDAPAKAPIIIGTTPAGKNVVSNLDTTIAAPTTANNPADKPTEAQQSNAATLGDVLNAGWNLQENGTAKDVVTPYDTVNFVDGQGTTVKINTTNGTVSNVTVNVKVDGSTIKFDDNGNLTAVQPDTEVNGNKVGGNINLVDSDTVSVAPVTDDKGDPTGGIQFNVNTASITPVTEGDKAGSVTGPVTPALTDALKAAQDELAALPADASEEVKQAAADKVEAAQNAVNKAGNAVATAQNVADAINASGWNATSGKVGTGKVEGTTKELINPSETVTFQAGDNMMLKQEGNVFTYSVNPNPVFNNVTAEAGVTIGKGDQAVNMTPIAPVNVLDKDGNIAGNNTAPAVNMNGATFTGLAPNLPVTSSVQDGDISPTKSQTIDPSKVNQSNVATLGDVLNAGWNLQANGTAADFVRPYDTVNFANSDTITVAEPETDGTTTTLKLEANTSPLVMNGATADNEGGNGTVATPANPKALATSGDVAKAINNSGFDLDVGSDTTTNGQVVSNDAATARVNPGKKVTVNAGRNIEVSRKGSDITVATSNDPVFNTVKVGGDNGVKLSAATGRDGVKELSVGSANAPTRITNVAKGVAPTDAVNVAQLKDEIGGVNNRINKLNKQRKAGNASGIAAANLLQAHREGQSVITAGVGQYQGQTGVAVGYSRLSDNGKVGIRLSLGTNTQKEMSAGAAVGYFW